MGNDQVVFKAGYEVDADNEEEAERKARRELLEELGNSGVSRFIADVEKLQ